MERKSAKELKKELQTLENNLINFKKRIANRLLDLCKQNPEAHVAYHADLGGTIIKAKAIGDTSFIDSINIETQLQCIETIEKYLADNQPYKQIRIEF